MNGNRGQAIPKTSYSSNSITRRTNPSKRKKRKRANPNGDNKRQDRLLEKHQTEQFSQDVRLSERMIPEDNKGQESHLEKTPD